MFSCRNRNIVWNLLVIGLALMTAPAAAQQRREVLPIGCFNNVRAGSGAYGYSVKLWTSDTGIIGFIDAYHGSMADPPMGIVTDLKYDRDDRKISFQTKLTFGLHFCSKHKGVPSQDLLSFEGVLKSDRLEGNLVVKDMLDVPAVTIDRHEDLILHKDDACRLESFQAYEIWRWYWQPVYDARGPAW